MCGIAGLYDLGRRPVAPELVHAMGELLRHRGPDDDGLWVAGAVGLAHRRLSIVDLSPRGRNPMPNEDESVWLVLNGEIYNYRHLRRDLLARGHRFRSETDSEVVLHLYEEIGLEAVAALDGMFAFALWDAAKRRLLLARDRFGVKPLYYTRVGSALAFASEVKAFTALPGFQVAPDPLALAEHFTFQNTFGERTFFRGVSLLPAGHLAQCEDGELRLHRYWDLELSPDSTLDLEQWAGELAPALAAAVERQLMSDVPVGSYLSGGMDTGAVSAIAARRLPGLHTFTCGFDLPEEASELERHFDERPAARELASRLGTTHHEIELGSEAMAPALPAVVWHLDEPRVGISYPIYYTAELVRRHVTVVLSGVGGDELFAGYPWRYEPLLEVAPAAFERELYRRSTRLLGEEEARALFSPELRRAVGDFSPFDSFRAVLAGTAAEEPLARALYFDFKTFLHGLLVVEDKLSMAHALETRVPFLDNLLVELVRRIPMRHRLQRGESKLVLRRALRELLPPAVLARRKQGFTPPDRSWYKSAAAPLVRELVLGERSRQRGHFEPRGLERILDEHQRDHRDHRFLLWSLMCFEWWNRLFVDGEPLPRASDGCRSLAGARTAAE